jgi:hypothetical protein
MKRQPCLVCGTPTTNGPRCADCTTLKVSYDDAEYQLNRAIILATPGPCWLCGKGARAGDPFTADHVVARELGGSNSLSNLAKAHRSCNSRRGQRLGGMSQPGGSKMRGIHARAYPAGPTFPRTGSGVSPARAAVALSDNAQAQA